MEKANDIIYNKKSYSTQTKCVYQNRVLNHVENLWISSFYMYSYIVKCKCQSTGYPKFWEILVGKIKLAIILKLLKLCKMKWHLKTVTTGTLTLYKKKKKISIS